jgi:ferredoxin-type protein NapF
MHSTRRSFLRGAFVETPAMRPFGASSDFAAGCTASGDSIRACKPAILRADDDGRPLMRLDDNACTFCGDCIRACDPGALKPDRP